MSIFNAHIDVEETLGTVEISVEAHDRGTVCLLSELVVEKGPAVLAEMNDAQAFELGLALVQASAAARRARLQNAVAPLAVVDA